MLVDCVRLGGGWFLGVGFGGGCALVLCPCDVLVKKQVVARGLCSLLLAGVEASHGFEFVCAGNGNGWG